MRRAGGGDGNARVSHGGVRGERQRQAVPDVVPAGDEAASAEREDVGTRADRKRDAGSSFVPLQQLVPWG